MHINIEIKARSNNNNEIRKILTDRNARFVGTDHQIDTYFNVPTGRLKLREGNIENNLIHYCREDKAGPKQSEVNLYKSAPDSGLKQVLKRALGVLTVVDKRREIYFLENVKFHLDEVNGLGSFAEIEAIDTDGSIGREKLLEQCNYYLQLFGINEVDLLKESYSDMLLEKQK